MGETKPPPGQKPVIPKEETGYHAGKGERISPVEKKVLGGHKIDVGDVQSILHQDDTHVVLDMKDGRTKVFKKTPWVLRLIQDILGKKE
jgi:hypothetical protein